MAEIINLNNVATFQNDTTAVNVVNTNNAAITTAFNDVLSRVGVSPNQMLSTLDMNNNQIINLPFPTTLNSPARLQDVTNAQNITIINAITGTSGHTVPFLDGVNTWSAIQNFNAGVLSTITNPSGFSITNNFNSFSIATDNLDASGVGNVANAFNIYLGFGGSTTKGARQGLLVTTQLTSATSATNTNRSYVGGTFVSQAVSSDGGGIGTEKGTLFGLNPIVILNAAATNMAAAVGGEVNTSVASGATVLDKYGWAITQLYSDVFSGSRNDAGLYFANQAGSVGWLNGIQFGNGIDQFPVKSAGTLIKTKGGATVINGIDFSATTCSGNAIVSNGFTLGPVGSISLGGASVSQGLITLFGSVSGSTFLQINNVGNLLTMSQPIQIGVIGTTAGTLNLAGATSGSAQLSSSATGGTLQLGAGNLTIDASGNLTTSGTMKIGSTIAPVSGGDASHAYLYGSGTNFGIYFGAGAPTITAAQGSIYLNTTGSTNVTRAYINTTGSTTWTAINTVA